MRGLLGLIFGMVLWAGFVHLFFAFCSWDMHWEYQMQAWDPAIRFIAGGAFVISDFTVGLLFACIFE